MSCIRVPAYLTAWRDAGIAAAIDHAVTVSGSGGGVGAYLSGMPHRATRMFEALAVSGFIAKKGCLAPEMRLSLLADVLRGEFSPVAFDQEKIVTHRSSWHVIATKLSGQSAIIDAKEVLPDAAQAVLASSAFPGLAAPIPLHINNVDEQWIDGACGMPLPIGASIKKFRPDTVIVLESVPSLRLQPWLERSLKPCLIALLTCRLPSALRSKIASMDRIVELESESLSRRKRIRWCRITPTRESTPIGPLTTDLGLLRQAAGEAQKFMATQLQYAQLG